MARFPRLPAEDRLLRAFPAPGLEAYRQALLAAVSSGPDDARARNVLRRALDTELAALFSGILALPLGVLDLPLPLPRRLIDIDRDLTPVAGAFPVAERELLHLGIPAPVIELLRAHLADQSFQHRVSGTAAVVLLAALLLVNDTAEVVRT
jgi:hypothetical protein